MNPNPYESPQTPPPRPVRRQANAQALGKVLALAVGIIVLALCAGAGFMLYALFTTPWLEIGTP